MKKMIVFNFYSSKINEKNVFFCVFSKFRNILFDKTVRKSQKMTQKKCYNHKHAYWRVGLFFFKKKPHDNRHVCDYSIFFKSFFDEIR